MRDLSPEASRDSERPMRRRRPRRFSRLVFYAAAVLFILGFCLILAPIYSGSLRFGRSPAPVGLWVAASVGMACVGVSSAARRYWKRNVAIWGSLSVLSSAACIGLHLSWQAQHARFMRAHTALVHLEGILNAALYEPTPLMTYAELAVPGEHALDPTAFLLGRSELAPGETRVGPYTLAEFAGGVVSRAALRAAMEPRAGSSEWELIGDFVVSRRSEFMRSEDSSLVMGVSEVCSEEGHRSVVYADGHSEMSQLTPS